jgi:hypothetical protein
VLSVHIISASNTTSLRFEVNGVETAFFPSFLVEKQTKWYKPIKRKISMYLVRWIGSNKDTWEPAKMFDDDPGFEDMVQDLKERMKASKPPPEPEDPPSSFGAASATNTDPSFQPPHDKDVGPLGPSTQVLPTPPASAAEENNLPEMKKQTNQEVFENIAAKAKSQAEAENAAAPTMRRTRSESKAAASTERSLMIRSRSAGGNGRSTDVGDGNSLPNVDETSSPSPNVNDNKSSSSVDDNSSSSSVDDSSRSSPVNDSSKSSNADIDDGSNSSKEGNANGPLFGLKH